MVLRVEIEYNLFDKIANFLKSFNVKFEIEYEFKTNMKKSIKNLKNNKIIPIFGL
jgi:hypothetical protein